MANKKISELVLSNNPPLSGVTTVVHGGTTYQSTLGTLRQLLVDSGSHAFTGSQTINGNLIVSGSLTAQEYILSSSITNITTETISGSSRFGNSSDDVHSFTGSLRIDGRIDRLLVGTGSYLTGVDDDPEILHVQNSESYNIAHFQADNPFYAQINIKNTNSGSFASTDLVLTADNGTEIIHHVNLGINSSTYNGGAVGYNNDSYLINAGKDMYVGTLGGSQHPAKVKLFTMGNWQTPHITLHTGTTISFNTSSVSDGFEYEFSGSVKLKNNLNVSGSVTASYFVGDGSQLTNLSSQTINTGSLATTGSNIFNGNQTINGSIILDNGAVIKDNENNSISFGYLSAETNQGTQSVAIGNGAGYQNQSNGTVAIGTNAGAINQGQRAVALGSLAGTNTQGEYAVAIGNFAAPNNQAANSIVINAIGSGL
jgi:hypothetical protein